MSLLCKCIRLNLIAEVKTDSGGAESTWSVTDAKHATYTVELLAGASCGGTDAFMESKLDLKMNGCGRLRVTASGQGSLFSTYPDVIAWRTAPSSAGFLHLIGPGGGSTGCGSGDLELFSGANPAEFDVCCGQTIQLWVIMLNTSTPELTIEFAVEVIG